jgi:cephalosporin hydroxylase
VFFKKKCAQCRVSFNNFLLRVRRLRRPEYHRRFKMSLRKWLMYHQEEIVFKQVKWMGHRVMKNPLDAWIYQEIIYDVQPDVIVEIGSRYGGSTKYFANLLDLIGKGVVVSIDINRTEYTLEHQRVKVLTGDSASSDIVENVADLCKGKSVLVIHDGDHSKSQVLKDLSCYAGFVSPGSYFIVEDGIVDLFHYGDGLGFKEGGPLAAVEEFLKDHPEFVIDEERERYLLTYNPKGFLKRRV